MKKEDKVMQCLVFFLVYTPCECQQDLHFLWQQLVNHELLPAYKQQIIGSNLCKTTICEVMKMDFAGTSIKVRPNGSMKAGFMKTPCKNTSALANVITDQKKD